MVVGFAPEEVVTDEPTRSARLKWVVVVDAALPPGRATNAVACIAATTGAAVDGLVARGGPDAAGDVHPGLPWAGCSVLAASAEQLADVRARAVAAEGVLVVDMPAAAQAHREYDDYLAELAGTAPEDLRVGAVSVVGPRNRVDKLVKRLALLA
ncbi:DUF2000 domain-containing protein [Vallicoccus soli]|uniref:DUF2000 domain-containing protein n=1 Tax=Vallicoccus soli TaxID=2339232 RepID=A0A3A3ZK22_9ACTN|nr:DUF2000 domain-containing protein [Vallicoccus soli]